MQLQAHLGLVFDLILFQFQSYFLPFGMISFQFWNFFLDPWQISIFKKNCIFWLVHSRSTLNLSYRCYVENFFAISFVPYQLIFIYFFYYQLIFYISCVIPLYLCTNMWSQKARNPSNLLRKKRKRKRRRRRRRRRRYAQFICLNQS